jgi:coenzyme F420-reducing hydrogenase beta subunit
MPDLAGIKAEAKRLLREGIVEVVLAFKASDSPLHPQPAFFRSEDEIDQLIYNGLCANNLARYLTRLPKQTKLAVVARGCETRSVNALIVEAQKKREDLFLIGVPCEGIIDWRKIIGHAGENSQLEAENEDQVRVRAGDSIFSLARADLLHESCRRCVHRNPISADIVIGEPVQEQGPENQEDFVNGFRAKTLEERYRYFQQEAERCIRCYACREACPMCYCAECFVDHIAPRWTESGATPAGTQGWHIVRAFHQAGRCTSCGACERACPMDIKMTWMTEKLNRDMREKYNFECGMDAQTKPPFATVTLDDKQRFTAGGSH